MGLTLGYVVRRLALFVLIVWITATINFLVPGWLRGTRWEPC